MASGDSSYYGLLPVPMVVTGVVQAQVRRIRVRIAPLSTAFMHKVFHEVLSCLVYCISLVHCGDEFLILVPVRVLNIGSLNLAGCSTAVSCFRAAGARRAGETREKYRKPHTATHGPPPSLLSTCFSGRGEGASCRLPAQRSQWPVERYTYYSTRPSSLQSGTPGVSAYCRPCKPDSRPHPPGALSRQKIHGPFRPSFA